MASFWTFFEGSIDLRDRKFADYEFDLSNVIRAEYTKIHGTPKAAHCSNVFLVYFSVEAFWDLFTMMVQLRLS